MINSKFMPNFIIDIIRYADDKDIKTLLLNSKAKSYQWKPQDLSDKAVFKGRLLACLFDYIYEFIEPDLFIKPDLTVENGKIIEELPISAPPYLRKRIANHKLLYLHLYALSECYHSYQCYFPNEEKNKIYKMQKAYSEKYGSDKNKKILTKKDITKLLQVLINSYTENGFYYYFYDDELVKLEIKQIMSLKKSGQKYIKDYKFVKTVYSLEDTQDTTYIINDDIGVNINLKQKLIRNQRLKTAQMEINPNENNFMEYFESLFGIYDFQDIKNVHEKLVKILKKEKKETCKCCNPDISNSNLTKICDKCKNLFSQFSELQELIDDTTASDYLYKLKDKNIKSELYKYKIKDGTNINVLRNERKKFLSAIVRKIKREIEKAKINPKDSNNYSKISGIANNLQTLISDIFDD